MKTVQRLKSAEADLLKREHEPVRVAVNLHAAVPSNATDDHVSEKQLHKQFDVLKQECMCFSCDNQVLL